MYFIHLPMKMELKLSSETSAIRTQTPGNYPKRTNYNHLSREQNCAEQHSPDDGNVRTDIKWFLEISSFIAHNSKSTFHITLCSAQEIVVNTFP